MARDRSSYLDYLPALFQEDAPADPAFGLARFLLAFEHVLTGLGDVDSPGLEEILDGATEPETGRRLAGVERYFDPGVRPEGVLPESERVPDEGGFLDWLAEWVALVPRGDVGVEIKRQLVARAVPLYRKRGTKDGLEELLRIYALGVRIEEYSGWLQLGVSSRVGVDTRLDGPPPHAFRVVLVFAPEAGPVGGEEIARQRRLLEAIIEAEKPAHTQYTLDVELPDKLQVGVHSTVGVDTMLG
jgi:phage tail-like protein